MKIELLKTDQSQIGTGLSGRLSSGPIRRWETPPSAPNSQLPPHGQGKTSRSR